MKDKKLDGASKAIDEAFLRRLDNEDFGDVPPLQAPELLRQKVYRIPDCAASKKPLGIALVFSSALAASLLMAVFFVTQVQKVPSEAQLDTAQQDLVTALHYLSKTQTIAQSHFQRAMSKNLRKSSIEPIIEAIPYTQLNHTSKSS